MASMIHDAVAAVAASAVSGRSSAWRRAAAILLFHLLLLFRACKASTDFIYHVL